MNNIDNTLLKQNPHWGNEKTVTKYVDRDLVGQIRLDSKFIEIITGVRRSGKSTIFNILIEFLIKTKKANKKEILFVNFDNPNFVPFYKNVQNLDEIIAQAEVLTGEKIKYLFLDEVQNVALWEKWVKSAYDQKEFKKIFITGSNSNLLENKYISRLSGRYFAYTNFTFSFKEYLRQRKQVFYQNILQNFSEKHKLLKFFNEYLRLGGFPEVVIEHDSDIVDSYYQTIILKDVINNNDVRDSVSLKELAYYLVTNSTGLFSYGNIAKNLKINEKTVQEYLEYLKSSYLFFELRKYDYSVKKQIVNKKKIYVIDNSFIDKIGFSFSSDKGKYLENLIMIEFLRRGQEVFYYNKNYECDFVVKEKTKICQAYQVCYELNEQNRKREMSGLLDAMEEYKLKAGTIITHNQKEEIIVGKKKIQVVPAFEWLLNVK